MASAGWEAAGEGGGAERLQGWQKLDFAVDTSGAQRPKVGVGWGWGGG